MRVLAHVHTFNDADIIDRTIESLLQQTRPVDGIVLVDNASKDDTLEQPLVRHTTVVQHRDNQGTSGAVATGLEYGLDQGYDWVWVFDADSTPEPDALEKLLELYDSWPPERQEETAFLACLPYNVEDNVPRHGGVFLKTGFYPVTPEPGQRAYLCHATIWSGILFRTAAVRDAGVPNRDYQLDWGEIEYGYRLMKAGYKCYIDQQSVLHHNVRGYTSLRWSEVKFGPIRFKLFEFAPIRCYYMCRNTLYFMLYEMKENRLDIFFRQGIFTFLFAARFMLRPRRQARQIGACLRGIWNGATGNIAARF